MSGGTSESLQEGTRKLSGSRAQQARQVPSQCSGLPLCFCGTRKVRSLPRFSDGETKIERGFVPQSVSACARTGARLTPDSHTGPHAFDVGAAAAHVLLKGTWVAARPPNVGVWVLRGAPPETLVLVPSFQSEQKKRIYAKATEEIPEGGYQGPGPPGASAQPLLIHAFLGLFAEWPLPHQTKLSEDRHWKGPALTWRMEKGHVR